MDQNLIITEKDSKVLEEYENYPNNNNRIYKNIYELIEYNPIVTYGDKIIIYFVNWPCGFGSALTVFLQNAFYLKQFNKKLIMLPYFCENAELFKYHEESYNNSFFLYFKYKKQDRITSMKDYSVFFVKSCHLVNLPGVVSKFPIEDENTLSYLRYFADNFEIRIGENIREYIKTIKTSSPTKPLIGIHIRSIIQKIIGCPNYLKISVNDRINTVKENLDKEYNNNYTLFIATDVELYIIKCMETFGYTNIKYLNFINRILNEHDSIPQLETHKGFKLGSDILYECLALSLCDKVYVSNSNVPFMIYMLNPSVPMEEY
jgi:hypothetical protein